MKVLPLRRRGEILDLGNVMSYKLLEVLAGALYYAVYYVLCVGPEMVLFHW